MVRIFANLYVFFFLRDEYGCNFVTACLTRLDDATVGRGELMSFIFFEGFF